RQLPSNHPCFEDPKTCPKAISTIEVVVSYPRPRGIRKAALRSDDAHDRRWRRHPDRASHPGRAVAAGRGQGVRHRHRLRPEPPGERGQGCPRRRLRRSEEHTSELQSRENLVCRLLLEKKKKYTLRL